jgi:hypothetical protein
MDDVIDLRTRLIYASLSDVELVRELEQARADAAARTRPRSAERRLPSRSHGTRPWLTTVTPAEADDLMDSDVTSSGAEAFVVDVRSTDAPAVTVDVRARTMPHVVQRTSEWSTDDSSYYLG